MMNVMANSGLADFLAMGGHGLYVWGSFGIVAVVMLVNVVVPMRTERRLREEIRYRAEKLS